MQLVLGRCSASTAISQHDKRTIVTNHHQKQQHPASTLTANNTNADEKMNGLSLSELCCLFCCPPCPGRIASKLAFLPPECSYELKADEAASTKFSITLLDRADWQYTEREKEYFEAFYTRSSRGNRIACLFVRCSTNAR